MTLNEYRLRFEAYQLKKVEKQHEMAIQALMYRNAKAQDKSGKHYRFNSPEQLFDRDFAIDEVRKNFESDYQPSSKKSREKAEQELVIERMRKWREMQKGG